MNYKVLLLTFMLLFMPSVVLAQYSGRVGDYIELPLPTLPPGGFELVSAMYGTEDPDIAVASGTNRVKILSWFSGHQTVTCEVHAVKQVVDYSGNMQEFHNYYTVAFFISCSSSPTPTPDSDPDPKPNYAAENPSNYYTDYGCWGTVTIKSGESKTFYHNFDIINADKVQSIVWSDYGSYGFYISSQSQSSCTIKGFGSCSGQKLWCLMKYGSGTYKGYYLINVIPAIEPIGITTSNPVVKLKENESYTLSYSLVPSNANINTSVTWSSDDTSIATVTSSGKITGMKPGTTYVRVKTANGKSDFCQVTVEGSTVLVSKIELNNTSLTLNSNDTKQLSATIYPSNATDTSITWLSSNTDVATVSPNGLVAAKAIGSATITCKANDDSGIYATCKINVEGIVGQSFTAKTVEGVNMRFVITDAASKTCKVDYYAVNYDTEGSITIPSQVYGYSVTDIESSAFDSRNRITSVTIPNSVTRIGADAFYGCRELAKVNINSLEAWFNIKFENTTANPLFYAHNLYLNGVKMTDLIIPNTVTSIGEWAFYRCSGITSVTIPSSVTSIGKNAFYHCDGLTKVNISSIDAWCNIKFGSYGANPLHYAHNLYLNEIKVIDLIIPNTVSNVSDMTFYGCSSLTSVTIPNSVISIGNNAFAECYGLTEVNINSIDAWCNIKFGSYGANPLVYAHDLYLNGNKVTDLKIPSTVTNIPEGVFNGCTCITSVVVDADNPYYCSDDNVIYTKDKSTLVYCVPSKKGDMVIPNSVTNISDMAFSECASLTSVTIPNSVTSIGNEAFSGCEGLVKVNISSIEAWCNIQFKSNPLSTAHDLYLNDEKITDLVIPNSVVSIGDMAFYNCTSLTSVTISNSVTSIGRWVFAFCEGLTSISIPKSVTSIGESAFEHCSGLASVTIPETVIYIGDFAFYGCDSLVSIHSEIIDPSKCDVGYLTFDTDKETVLYVPTGTKSLYESVSPWNLFKNIVEEEPKPDHVPGDVNSDELVNGADIVALNDVIAGKTEGGVSADTNGDGVIDEKDYNDLIARVLNNTDIVYPEHDEQCRVQMDVPAVYIKEGEKAEVFVGVSNPDDAVTLVQFDMQLPDGIKVCKSGDEYDFDIVSRTSWRYHSLYGNAVNNDTRILLASASNRSISGSDGLLISVMIEADDSYTGGNILLKNILLVSPDHSEFRPKAIECELRNTADGIADIPVQSASKKVFSISGQHLSAPQKGINIINGKKVIVK